MLFATLLSQAFLLVSLPGAQTDCYGYKQWLAASLSSHDVRLKGFSKHGTSREAAYSKTFSNNCRSKGMTTSSSNINVIFKPQSLTVNYISINGDQDYLEELYKIIFSDDFKINGGSSLKTKYNVDLGKMEIILTPKVAIHVKAQTN